MSKSKKRKSSHTDSISGDAVSIGGRPVNMTWLAVFGIGLIAVAGFLAWRSFQSGGSSISSVPLSDTVGAQLGEIAPDFTVPTLDGGTYTLADQRGKPTIVFFMAYWCGTCIPEAQALARLQQEYGDRISIIALDVDPTSTPEALARFKQAADDGPYTWAFDTDQRVTQVYEVRSLDTTVILDADGRVVYRDAFITPYQTLREALAQIGY
jgi:thiol-disulfide isomerase/thioredoxin